MNDKEQRFHLYQQYTEAYGPLAEQGEYAIGEHVYYGSMFTRFKSGEILWKYVNAKGHLIYVIDSGGWPEEVNWGDIARKVE